MTIRPLFGALALLLASCTPPALDLKYPATWRPAERDKAPRWVVAYPETHASALAPLKQARGQQGYKIISIPGASRLRIEERIDRLQLGERRDDCLLLIGTTTALPAPPGRFHRMIEIPSDARYAMKRDGSTPLFAVGRLPSSSPQETRMLVARILAIEEARRKNHGKSAVLIVGDPMSGTKRMGAADALVTSLSKSLLRRADSSWTITGAADVPGHPFAYSSEEFPAAFRSALNQPYAVGAYFGHSTSDMLCRTSGGTGTLAGTFQHSFGRHSWDELTPSSERGLFLSCGCFCLEEDGAVGYRSVMAPGGPVAFIGATKESYSSIGYLAAKGAVGVMDERPPRIVGNWFLAVQNAIATEKLNGALFFAFDRVDGSNGTSSLHDQRQEHLEMWMLVGDPATRLF